MCAKHREFDKSPNHQQRRQCCRNNKIGMFGSGDIARGQLFKGVFLRFLDFWSYYNNTSALPKKCFPSFLSYMCTRLKCFRKSDLIVEPLSKEQC